MVKTQTVGGYKMKNNSPASLITSCLPRVSTIVPQVSLKNPIMVLCTFPHLNITLDALFYLNQYYFVKYFFIF